MLSFDSLTADVLHELDHFLRNEYDIATKYPDLYELIPETRFPKPRGNNTVNDKFKMIRTFYTWAMDQNRSQFNPFTKFTIKESVYGTPYYITIEERDKIYHTNLSRHPHLAIQRDIFVFQCLIGCRVGDLYRMTKNSIINGAVEYIARKTQDGRPVTVRVPLSDTAKEILARYPKVDGNRILPFIAEQNYNYAIKDIFRAARICRPVTVLNPTTSAPEIRPINEIASSHMARRCFIGNLYKKVKDPNLVGALSGHKEGSKAFVRYRDIDEEMKVDLVKLLEK